MSNQATQAVRRLRIYTVFSSEGVQPSSGSYPIYHPDQRVLTNEEMLSLLRQRLPEVEFIGDTKPCDASYATANIAAQRKAIDGVLYFGAPPEPVLEANVPTVAVFPLWGQWQYPFNAYHDSRVVTACLPVIPDSSGEVFEARLDDIAGKIRLIGALSKLKGHRVLVVTDQPILGAYEPTSFQTGPARAAWEQEYLRQVEDTFGASLVVIPQAELVAQMRAESEEEAQRIARQWIDESQGIKQTTEEQVVASARLYLAMKTLMDKYDCGSITTEGYGVFHFYREGPIPSQGMPSSVLCTEGIIATSETLIDSLFTQHLGHYITGFAGFNGDFIVDPLRGMVYIGHCECPFNPWGDERRVPYYLRQLPQMWEPGKWEEGTGGVCVEVLLPVGEQVTVAKLSVHDRKLSLFGGETVDGEQLFPNFSDILCRTKVAIRTDAQAVFEKLDWKTFGVHRVVFFGDWRQQFKDLAKLMGFEVVEKDRA